MILTSLLFHLLVSSFPPFTGAKRNLLSLPLSGGLGRPFWCTSAKPLRTATPPVERIHRALCTQSNI